MISRLMLSLKKASKDKGGSWTSNALSSAPARTGTQIEFATHSDGTEDGTATTSDEGLSDFSNSEARDKSEEEKV